MKTPTKITMFAYDADGKTKDVFAVFRLVDGKAQGDFKGPAAERNSEEYESYGIFDKKNKRTVKMEDGEDFMQALPDAFSHSTYLSAVVDEED